MTLNACGAAKGHVLADGGDGVGNGVGHRAGVAGIMLVLERVDFGHALFIGDQRDGLDQSLEFLVASDEIGFGIDLDDHAVRAMHRHADQTFSRDAAGLLGGLGQALLAQPVDGRLDVAAGLVERALAIHHARAGFFAQVLHHCGGDIGHETFPSSFGGRSAPRPYRNPGM